MTTDEVLALPVDQKLRIMAALWEDMREQFDKFDATEAQKKLLDHRQELIDSGRTKVYSWSEATALIDAE